MTCRAPHLALSVLAHALWGLHPVCSRFLQTRPLHPLPGLALLAVAQLTALAANFGTRLIARTLRLPRPPGTAGADTVEQAASPRPWISDPAARKLALAFGSCAAVRAALNMESTFFTLAHNIQLVAMGAPLITAIISHLIIREVWGAGRHASL